MGEHFLAKLSPTSDHASEHGAGSDDIDNIPEENLKKKENWDPETIVMCLIKTVAILCIATVLAQILDYCKLGLINVVMMYMMGVVMVAYFIEGRLYGVAASVASVLLFNFFFTEPRFSFRADASIYPFTFLAMLFCSLVISSMTAKMKRQAQMASEETRKMQILINISNELKMAEGEDEMMDICAKQVRGLLKHSVILYNTSGFDGSSMSKSKVFLHETAADGDGRFFRDEEEIAVAKWVYTNCHRAGCTTNTYPDVNGYYMPITKDDVVYAVIGIEMGEHSSISSNDKNVLHVILNEAAIVLKIQLKH